MSYVLVASVALIFVVGALVVVLSVLSRVERAEDRATKLVTENVRLMRALGVAEQAMRSLSYLPAVDTSTRLQIDAALTDIQRATEGENRGLT